MIGGIVIGLLDLIPELFIEDEKERAAAKASIAGTVGVVLAPLDPSAPVVGALMAAKEGAVLAVEKEAKSGVGAAFDVASDALSSSPIGIAKKLGGAAVGGAVAVAAGGEEELAAGLQLGASIAEGRVEKMAAKAGGAAIGGAIGAASGDARGAKLGMQMGVTIGGAAANLEIDAQQIKSEREPSIFEATKPEPTQGELEKVAADARLAARIDLAAQAAGVVAAGAIYAAADANGEADAIAALEAAHGLAQSASGFIGAGESPWAAIGAAGRAAQPAANVVAEITTRAEIRALEERAAAGDPHAQKALENIREADRKALIAAAGAARAAALPKATGA